MIRYHVRIYPPIGFDMFPRVDKRRKNDMISFDYEQNGKIAVDMFLVMSVSELLKFGGDIHSVFTTHVEMVCLLSKLYEAKHYVKLYFL